MKTISSICIEIMTYFVIICTLIATLIVGSILAVLFIFLELIPRAIKRRREKRKLAAIHENMGYVA